jgi:hypothetical protein
MPIENTLGAKQLPQILFNGKPHFVDFRLKEMRDVETAMPVKFSYLKGKKQFDQLKRDLRMMRFLHDRQEYVEGLDD